MVPKMIILWAGAVVNIPAGWHLCDGSAGTPDLRNKFVPGAGDTYNPGDTGGADSQQHAFTSAFHVHGLKDGEYLAAGTDFEDETDEAQATGTTDAADNRPQYYSLAYIMKL